jgi:hypothetical protein
MPVERRILQSRLVPDMQMRVDDRKIRHGHPSRRAALSFGAVFA